MPKFWADQPEQATHGGGWMGRPQNDQAAKLNIHSAKQRQPGCAFPNSLKTKGLFLMPCFGWTISRLRRLKFLPPAETGTKHA
ncbi:hypothetical protein [Salaquimonas pukyongi]|uniref:hypothetical protein n=1 Tax=Salaquimonas pukyongi TaxID=2712698 RepID=UPI0012EBA7D3|nr:hypothetical protein [Salaquimonas pukyongi]